MAMSKRNFKLPHPPIIEAVIDIRTVPIAEVTIADLESLQDKIITDYPTKEPRYNLSAQLKIEPGKSPILTEDSNRIFGYLFKSSDGKKVVQYRLNGFSFSRLTPYEGWKRMRTEAKRLWDIYSRNIKLTSVTRLAVRYINQIALPKESLNLDYYFELHPKVPKKFPKPATITEFSSHLQLNLADNFHAIINHGTNASLPHNILLDIDIFLLSQFENPSDPAIWELFDTKFRTLKDEIFRYSLTTQGFKHLKNKTNV